MALRKEQVMALAVLAIGAWMYSGFGLDEDGARSPFLPKKLDYTAAKVANAALVDKGPDQGGRRDLFTQPRETRPLPPRDLEFPDRTPASVVALPLEPGPDFAHLVALASPGAVVEGVVLPVGGVGQNGGASGQGGASDPAAPADPQDRAARFALATKTYDQVWLQGQSAPFLGIVEVPGKNLFDAEKLGESDFEQLEVRLRMFDLNTGKIGAVKKWLPGQLVKVAKIRLADKLANHLERKRREIPEDAGSLKQRGEFLQELLDTARVEAWVYDLAMAQAKLYTQLTDAQDLEGLRWQLRVLRAQGDLAGEFALLDGITGPHRESAFRYEGLGVLEARLGLTADAERDLRRAVELAAHDARPVATLADFLLKRGRSDEAVLLAQRAERSFGSLTDVEERIRVVRVLVACHLAVAAIDAAKTARQLLSADQAPPYLDGCIAYAAGDVDGALVFFRRAGSGVDQKSAQLGEAACLLRLGKWQEAQEAFLAVYDTAPLLRHRAAAGLSLLQQRIGAFDAAVSWIDRALEANPQDAYAHYLRGRALRLSGQLQAAGEAQDTALRSHDDFVHVILEKAMLHAERAKQSLGAEQATLAIRAMRYSDRAVELAPKPMAELFEYQGLRHFAAADPRGASKAFESARDTATTDPGRLFAKGALAVVEYSLGHVDDAVAVLDRMAQDLAKEDQARKWAERAVAAIFDHAEKEMLEDRFERNEPGSIWTIERDGGLTAEVKSGALVFREKFARSGQVHAVRTGAVQKGKNFLAVAIAMHLGSKHTRAESFAGLRIESQQGSTGRTDSQIEVGIRNGRPYLRVTDDRQDPKPTDLEVLGFDAGAVQQLELRVLPQGEEQGRTFVLQVTWNGQVVHSQPLKSLGGQTSAELKTILFAEAPRGSDCDVSFDDYRLERRKEK